MRHLSAKSGDPYQEDKNKPLVQWAWFLVVLALLCVAIPVDVWWTVRLRDTDADTYALASTGFLQRQIAIAALGIGGLISASRKVGSTLRIRGSLGWLLIVFLGWALLSSIWTDSLSLMVRRFGSLLLLSLAALGFSERFSLKRIIAFTISGCGAFLVVGLAAELLLSTFHPLSEGYRFAGLMHPNALGQTCATLLIAIAAAARLTKANRWTYWLTTPLVLMLLLLTKSRTSLAVAIVGCGLFYGMTIQRKRWIVIGLALVACITSASIILFGDGLVRLVGNASSIGRADFDLYTLTGRLDLWEDLLPYVEKHPLIGYGYGSFWTPARLFYFSGSSGLASAHSEYLEIILDLGLVGLLAYLLILFMVARASVLGYRRSAGPEYAFAFSYLLSFNVGLLTTSAAPYSQLPSFLFLVLLMRLGFVESVS